MMKYDLSNSYIFSRRAFLLCWALAFPGLAVGQAWVITPELNLQGGYDDNLNLRPDFETVEETKEKSIFETNASIAAELARVTPISALSARVRLDFVGYSQEDEKNLDDNVNNNFDNSVDNEDNQYVDVSGHYNITPINDIGLRIGLERKFTGTTTRAFGESFSEVSLEDAGNDNLSDVDTDTGVSRIQVRRERVQAEPYWSIGLTQNTRLKLQYRYDDSAYGSGAELARLIDFTRQRASVRVEHKWSQRGRVFVSLDGGNYEAPDKNRENDEIAVRVGLRHNFSPISVVGFTVGARQLSFENSNSDRNEDDDVGAIFRIFGEHRGELTRYTASIGRTITPSGTGALVESDIANFNFTRSLSPRFDFHFESEYFGNSSVGDSNEDLLAERDYVRVSPQLRWNWTPEWSINLIYRYQWEDRDTFPDSADSNAAFISIIYKKDNEIGQ